MQRNDDRQRTDGISRRDFLRLGTLGAASAALGTLQLPEFASTASRTRKPNIILILSDDQGYAEIGSQGCRDIPTPNIDSIAANGVRFTDGYVSCPVCSPSRAGLMTGRYQQHFGHELNPATPRRQPDFGLDLSETTLAQRLKSAGYATGLVGKWHLGYKREFLPLQRGFDEFFGFPSAQHTYFYPNDTPDNPIMRGNEPVDEEEYLTDALSREATAFIRKHAEHPFFLYLAFNAVHSPLEAPDKYLDRFPTIESKKRRKYAAVQAAMDDAVGSVLAEVRKAGLEEDTLVFFLSDNGGPTTITTSSNAPFRGEKCDVWEGGIRIPFAVQWKGKLAAGKVYEQPVISLDIHATALAAAGVATPSNKKLDGVDLMPYLSDKQEDQPHEALFWRFGEKKAVRRGRMKLVWPAPGVPQLYDLSKDPGEAHDLASAQPETVKELEAAYLKWEAGMIPPKWGPPNPPNLKKRKAEAGDD